MKKEMFIEWIRLNNPNPETRKMIQRIFDAGPTRQVKSRKGNVITMAPSDKNGRDDVFTESRTIELPYSIITENDPDVLGSIEQPLPMELEYIQDGRQYSFTYTPDFFEFRTTSAGWVELKSEKNMQELLEKQPGRYQEIDGKYRSLPAEQYAAKFGLTYSIVTDASFNYIYLQNLDYLSGYYMYRESLRYDPEVMEKVLRTVSAYPGISLQSLKEELSDISPDVIIGMIAKELIWVDLNATLLVLQADKVKVYSNKSTAGAIASRQPLEKFVDPNMAEFPVEGMKISWAGTVYVIDKVYGNTVWAEDEKGGKEKFEYHKLLKWIKEGEVGVISVPKFQPNALKDEVMHEYTSEEWEEADRKKEIVEEFRATGKIPKEFDKDRRTLDRWCEAYDEAEIEFGDPIYGLLPKHYKKGCRRVRIARPRLEKLMELLKNHYHVHECPNIESAYAAICHAAKEAGIVPPSRKLFKSMRDDMPKYEEELARAGKRSAQRYKGPADFDPNLLPYEGQWFLHRVHMDHVQLPLEILDPETGKAIGRPWLTILVDSATRCIVGWYITMANPSRKSVFMAMRDMVVRYHQLPEYLVSDNAKEFRSYDYKCLGARYRVKLQWRPPAEANFGADVERPGGTIQTMFINNLAGRTFPVQEARLRPGNLNPKKQAIWTLDELKIELGKFMHEDFELRQHPGLLMSPREAKELSWHEHGKKAHRNIDIDEEFLFLTTPVITTKRGYATVSKSGRGIKTGGQWYNCEQFRSPGVPGTKVQVRADPSNPDRCYACVKKQYVKLKRHITNSTAKKTIKSGSHDIYMAKRRATERANSGSNLELRGNMMARLEAKETKLRNAKDEAVNQYKQVPRLGRLKLVPKPGFEN